MNASAETEQQIVATSRAQASIAPTCGLQQLNVKALVGSGDRIGLATAPVLLAGVVLNVAHPSWFRVGGPVGSLRAISWMVVPVGILVWLWSVVLILTRVPRGELITGGPYAVVKHPLYTSVALLVLPWLGFLFNTLLGALVGTSLYLASRRFAPAEEAELAARFGPAWDTYCGRVKLPWV
jgi:protein-S-isoprenylcysteine O-methyltransferase Ste14